MTFHPCFPKELQNPLPRSMLKYNQHSQTALEQCQPINQINMWPQSTRGKKNQFVLACREFRQWGGRGGIAREKRGSWGKGLPCLKAIGLPVNNKIWCGSRRGPGALQNSLQLILSTKRPIEQFVYRAIVWWCDTYVMRWWSLGHFKDVFYIKKWSSFVLGRLFL